MYYYLKCKWFIGFDYYVRRSCFEKFQITASDLSMEKTNFCILFFVVFLTASCNSNDYNYDDYKYNEYNYGEDEYYGYNDQKPEDYTDDYYNQNLNDHYDQNLLAPPNPPPPRPTPHPIPPPPPRPMGKMTLFSTLDMMKYRFFTLRS